jgi:hypothetical protein
MRPNLVKMVAVATNPTRNPPRMASIPPNLVKLGHPDDHQREAAKRGGETRQTRRRAAEPPR